MPPPPPSPVFLSTYTMCLNASNGFTSKKISGYVWWLAATRNYGSCHGCSFVDGVFAPWGGCPNHEPRKLQTLNPPVNPLGHPPPTQCASSFPLRTQPLPTMVHRPLSFHRRLHLHHHPLSSLPPLIYILVFLYIVCAHLLVRNVIYCKLYVPVNWILIFQLISYDNRNFCYLKIDKNLIKL